MSLGFEQAGFDILASVEYDPVHTAVHRFNFPNTAVVCSDAATLTARRIRDAAARGWRDHGRADSWDRQIDVVIGGPPCQGFSSGGKREFDDPRNQLVFTFARLVGALKPKYFVMENVPGIESMPAGSDPDGGLLLELLVEEFEAFGYCIENPQVLNANAFGVPQDRRRFLVVGARTDQRRPQRVAAISRPRTRRGELVSDELLSALPPCPSVSDAIKDLPNLDDYASTFRSDEIELSSDGFRAGRAMSSDYAQGLRGEGRQSTDYSRPRKRTSRVITCCYRTVHAPAVVERFRATLPGTAEPISRLFRLHPDGVSSTLRAGTHYERGSFNAPRPIHPEFPRVISVREAARLHGFPDWFRLHWTKWHGFREVGNALPPPVGRAVAATIVASLGLTPSRVRSATELGDPSLLYLENLEAASRFGADKSRIPRNGLRHRRPPPVARPGRASPA